GGPAAIAAAKRRGQQPDHQDRDRVAVEPRLRRQDARPHRHLQRITLKRSGFRTLKRFGTAMPQTPLTPPLSALPTSAMNLADLQEVLEMYNQVTVRL